MSTTETRLLTVPEVAERLNVSRVTVYRRIADGTIPAVRLGSDANKSLRVDAAELEAWLYGDSPSAYVFRVGQQEEWGRT